MLSPIWGKAYGLQTPLKMKGLVINQLKAAVKQSLGNTYLEKYESLPDRNDELIRKVLFWSEAAFNLCLISGLGAGALFSR